MNSLYRYLHVIAYQEQEGLPSVVKVSSADHSYEDAGTNVTCTASRYEFSDGAIICCTEESDDDENDALCAEYWLTYRVLEHPEKVIEPATKQFTNRCQQAFWLKMQAVSR